MKQCQKSKYVIVSEIFTDAFKEQNRFFKLF
jgi:hypothetical protein